MKALGNTSFRVTRDQDIVEHLNLHVFGRACNEIVDDCVLRDWLVDVGAGVLVVGESNWRRIGHSSAEADISEIAWCEWC